MIDTHKALRKAYYDALNGYIYLNGTTVNVYDELAYGGGLANVRNYILMSTQTASEDSTLTKFGHETTMLLDIVAKTTTAAGKNILDEIASQILSIVIPSVGQNGLAAQPFLQIALVKKESDNYFPVQTTPTGLVLRRLLRFSQFIHEL